MRMNWLRVHAPKAAPPAPAVQKSEPLPPPPPISEAPPFLTPEEIEPTEKVEEVAEKVEEVAEEVAEGAVKSKDLDADLKKSLDEVDPWMANKLKEQ